MFKKEKKLYRQDKKLVKKLKHSDIYKNIMYVLFFIFPLKKIFLKLKNKKTLAIISITSGTILGKKLGYIDDFIVHTKARGKGIGKKLFTKALKNIEKEGSEYVFLVSRQDRKVSHHIYKKFGFIIISLGIGIIAYKKNKK